MSKFKNQAFMLKDLLKEKGCKIPLVSVQELLAQSYGYKNRHVAIEKEEAFKKAFNVLHNEQKKVLNPRKSDSSQFSVFIYEKNKRAPSIEFKTKKHMCVLALSKMMEKNIDVESFDSCVVEQGGKVVARACYGELIERCPKVITRTEIKYLDFYWGHLDDLLEDYTDTNNGSPFEAEKRGLPIESFRIGVETLNTFELKDYQLEKLDLEDTRNWETNERVSEAVAHSIVQNSLSEFDFTLDQLNLSLFLSEKEDEELSKLCLKVQDIIFEKIKDEAVEDVESVSLTNLIYVYDEENDVYRLKE